MSRDCLFLPTQLGGFDDGAPWDCAFFSKGQGETLVYDGGEVKYRRDKGLDT